MAQLLAVELQNVIEADFHRLVNPSVSQAQRRLISKVCRAAVKSSDVATGVTHFANSNGLSSFDRLALLMDCTIYEQGLLDGSKVRTGDLHKLCGSASGQRRDKTGRGTE